MNLLKPFILRRISNTWDMWKDGIPHIAAKRGRHLCQGVYSTFLKEW